MPVSLYTESLKATFTFWKYLGFWPDDTSKKYYKYYSVTLISSILVLYNVALIINLFYVPRKIELFVQEITFFFDVIAIPVKVFLILILKSKIFGVLTILESKEFQWLDETTRRMLVKELDYFRLYRSSVFNLGNSGFVLKCIIPLFASLAISSYKIPLPTSNYYFLSEKTKIDYFALIFIYQALGLYALMVYDVSTDAFFNGLIFFAITQIKILQHRFRNIKIEKNEKMSDGVRERVYILQLNECLRHYDSILKYCKDVQNIVNIPMFVKYSLGSMIICFILCGFFLSLSMDAIVFMLSYLVAMVLQIFIPSWLGTQISVQSEELVFAAYNSEWIPRTEPFRKSIMVFMQRTSKPIVVVGLKLFPVSLGTFTSIMKTAYSLVTLIKKIHDEA